MTARRYPKYPEAVNDLLDFARQARRFATRHPDAVIEDNILQHVSGFASDWGWTLMEIVLDHEDRQARFVAMWRKWRKHRSSRLKRSRK